MYRFTITWCDDAFHDKKWHYINVYYKIHQRFSLP